METRIGPVVNAQTADALGKRYSIHGRCARSCIGDIEPNAASVRNRVFSLVVEQIDVARHHMELIVQVDEHVEAAQ